MRPLSQRVVIAPTGGSPADTPRGENGVERSLLLAAPPATQHTHAHSAPLDAAAAPIGIPAGGRRHHHGYDNPPPHTQRSSGSGSGNAEAAAQPTTAPPPGAPLLRVSPSKPIAGSQGSALIGAGRPVGAMQCACRLGRQSGRLVAPPDEPAIAFHSCGSPLLFPYAALADVCATTATVNGAVIPVLRIVVHAGGGEAFAARACQGAYMARARTIADATAAAEMLALPLAPLGVVEDVDATAAADGTYEFSDLRGAVEETRRHLLRLLDQHFLRALEALLAGEAHASAAAVAQRIDRLIDRSGKEDRDGSAGNLFRSFFTASALPASASGRRPDPSSFPLLFSGSTQQAPPAQITNGAGGGHGAPSSVPSSVPLPTTRVIPSRQEVHERSGVAGRCRVLWQAAVQHPLRAAIISAALLILTLLWLWTAPRPRTDAAEVEAWADATVERLFDASYTHPHTHQADSSRHRHQTFAQEADALLPPAAVERLRIIWGIAPSDTKGLAEALAAAVDRIGLRRMLSALADDDAAYAAAFGTAQPGR